MALNPVAYTENVVRSFLRYQLTAYPFTDPNLYAQMRDLLSLDETRRSPLFKGPYVSLSRPFRQGTSIDTLIAEKLLHPHLRQRIPDWITHLYSHQERAIRAMADRRTTLVSTGTGSGKTECFLYPIVSQSLILRDQGAPPGISAGETVYPSEEVCSREMMRTAGCQPRILLTNVKQLELLLTRQQDIQLFSGARLDYLVFDEAHTFTGAMGAETACLIRRLRSFCNADPGHTVCVATSATIVDHNDPEAARKFASRFFGVRRAAVTTVGEDYAEETWRPGSTTCWKRTTLSPAR
ncbi:MAG: DEAD/DEAH box helicase [Candidatus Aminicenantes bacterium]|nr:DEAD/DEAH box helicase [Candidatus Aminicenantes bacterium]